MIELGIKKALEGSLELNQGASTTPIFWVKINHPEDTKRISEIFLRTSCAIA